MIPHLNAEPEVQGFPKGFKPSDIGLANDRGVQKKYGVDAMGGKMVAKPPKAAPKVPKIPKPPKVRYKRIMPK